MYRLVGSALREVFIDSYTCVDYIPALCTHRPSLLPIEWFSEIFGLESLVAATPPWETEKLT